MKTFNVGDRLTAEEVLAFLKATGSDGVYSEQDIKVMLEESDEYEVVEIPLRQLDEPHFVSVDEKQDAEPMVVSHYPDGSYKTVEGGYKQWKSQRIGTKKIKAIVAV